MKKIEYITGLKGIACLGVMLGHYVALYSYSSNNEAIKSRLMDIVSNRYLSMIFNSSPFWLQLFFVVSGYLACLSVRRKEYTMIQFVNKVISRILRFLIPMFGACLIIYAIYIVSGGWHYGEISYLSDNSWIAQNYCWRVGLVDVFIDPIRTLVIGISKFNPMWWCMRNILCISLVVHFVSYMGMILSNKVEFVKNTVDIRVINVVLMAIVFVMLYVIGQESIWAGMCGAVTCKIQYDNVDRLKLSAKLEVLLGILSLLLLFLAYYQGSEYKRAIAFSLLLIAISLNGWMSSFFSLGIFRYLGKLSLGIYSFHLPVLYIIGGLFFSKYVSNVSSNVLFVTGFTICIIVTLVLSIIYNVLVEKNSDRCITLLYRR